MKRFLLTFIIPLFFIPNLVSAQTKWENTPLREVLVKSKVLNRKILIDFYATWCSTCMQLDNEVLQKSLGKRLSSEFFCLKYDAEKGDGKELAKKFNVISYPTIVLLDKDGNEIDRVIDYEDADSFIKIVFDYAEGKGVITALEEQIAKEPKNVNLLFRAGEKFAFRGDEAKANKYLGKIGEVDPNNKSNLSDKALYTLGKFLYSRSLNNYTKAMAIFDELENHYPDSPYAKQTDIERAKAYLGMNKEDQGLSALQNYLLKNKTDPSAKAYNAVAWFTYKNNFHISEGLTAAKDGIALNPKSDGLYDTMAELYSALGEHDKAVNSIRKALELKPKDFYYRSQLDKFTKRRNESPQKK